MSVNWKLAEYLERHELTAYRLMQETGLSSNTIYPIARNEADQTSKTVLERVIKGLRNLTGEETQVSDILVYEDA